MSASINWTDRGLRYPLIDTQLVGYCKDCHWLLSGNSCRMILWGPRQPDIAKKATEVSMVASYSLKVHPTKFGCALWRDKNNSSTADSPT